MEEKLKQIIEEHELQLIKYTQERDLRNEKIAFMREHKFEHEMQFLLIQKQAFSDMFYDYRKAIEELRRLINAWES